MRIVYFDAKQEIFLQSCLCHALVSRSHLVESDSIEIIVLYNYWRVVVPELGQISPGLKYYVDWKYEGQDEDIKHNLDPVSQAQRELPGNDIKHEEKIFETLQEDVGEEEKTEQLGVQVSQGIICGQVLQLVIFQFSQIFPGSDPDQNCEEKK